VRAGAKQIFARPKGSMGVVFRTIGIARVRVKIGLANLVYNL
jgi:transposase, IS5 family